MTLAAGEGLTTDEVRLQRVLAIFAAAFALMASGYLAQGAFAGAEFPFVANSVAKDGLFAVLCLVAANDLRRFGWAVSVVVGGHVLIVFGLLFTLAFGDISSVAGSFDGPLLPGAHTLFWIWLVLAVGVTALLWWLNSRANRSRYRLRYLSQSQHRTVMALAQVLVAGEGAALTPEEVAANVDDYLYSFAAKAKWKSRLALTALMLYPLLRLRPPLPMMSPVRRREFIERAFFRDVVERRLPGFLRRPLQTIMFAAQQLVFIGYYADPRTSASTGYVPFSEREGFEEAMKKVDTARPRVDATTPREVDGDAITADVVIVGSGAAGAVIAHRLAELGRQVVVLERGRHVDPSDFTEDERVQFSNLYADGALQMSQDARFQVLQGMCVGGTTVVNNAVCFNLPADSLARWNDPDGLDAGLDEKEFAEALKRLRGWLPVQSQKNGTPLQAGADRFAHGVHQLGLDREPNRFDVVDANIVGCLGCGYCNYGCAYGKKLSMLDTALPWAQKRHGPDAVRVLSECDARRILRDGRRATGVECRLSDGRKLTVNANTVVVSGGALASSLLLQRSGIGGRRVGRGLSFNMGAPMTAEFGEKLDSYAGLQITHHLQPANEEGLILETWFNPVGAQALFMPGWFSDHFENMLAYDRMACVGSVVGTRSNGRVSRSRLTGAMKLDYVPHQDDLARLVRGLKLIGRIMLEAGATKVMPSTFRYLPCTTIDDLDEIDRHVRDNTDISLHSSHPQGGNALSRDPSKGVVGPDFRVHGTERLYLCDASLFPAAITVNPQLTVMALAEMAAAGVE
jgi:choline dehydrogenase-like flavoprotein